MREMDMREGRHVLAALSQSEVEFATRAVRTLLSCSSLVFYEVELHERETSAQKNRVLKGDLRALPFRRARAVVACPSRREVFDVDAPTGPSDAAAARANRIHDAQPPMCAEEYALVEGMRAQTRQAA